MKTIRSRGNPAFRNIVRLARSAQERRSEGLALIEGERLVSALHASGREAATLIIAESVLSWDQSRPLLAAIDAAKRIVLADSLFSSISQVVSAQGVMALVEIPPVATWPTGPETALLLDGIQDPGNLGSILRTAAAAGIRHVALSPGSASAWSPKVIRAGMGAHFHLSIHEDDDLLERVRVSANTMASTSPRAPTSIYEADLVSPISWLFGNEGAGLSQPLMDAAALRLRVPMAGPAESLNVAATVAICLFEQLRQRGPVGANAARRPA
ncbi:MAG: RNA methyltransferase [Betaproteobacteria bacterium]|nr:RNA methyltransferase [Betaproteobacteria bacterium]